MSTRRMWAIYDVYLGNPVLVERCTTKAGAMLIAQQRERQTRRSLCVVEQLLPRLPRRLPSNGELADESSEPAAS